jgi:hypothetical protein
MQVIMTAKFSDEVDISVRTRYNSACATVLRQMGIETSWTTVIAAIPEAFVEIMHVLTTVDEVSRSICLLRVFVHDEDSYHLSPLSSIFLASSASPSVTFLLHYFPARGWIARFQMGLRSLNPSALLWSRS